MNNGSPTAVSPARLSAAAPKSLATARAIAHLLDDCRIDPFLGLVLPGIGDALAGVLGLAIVGLAAAARVPKAILARMLLNTALDVSLGALPLVGDAFDFYFHANKRNVALFERASHSRRTTVGDWLFLLAAALSFVLAITLPIVAGIFALRWLWSTYAT